MGKDTEKNTMTAKKKSTKVGPLGWDDMTLPNREALESLARADLFEHLQLVDSVFTERNDDQNVKEMREASGNKTTNRLLVAFLYILVRDVLTPGSIERILLTLRDRNDGEGQPGLKLTNGWIADYAENIADRLLNNWISKKRTSPTEGTHAGSQLKRNRMDAK